MWVILYGFHPCNQTVIVNVCLLYAIIFTGVLPDIFKVCTCFCLMVNPVHSL